MIEKTFQKPIKTLYRKDGRIVEIHYDEPLESPREYAIGHMVCHHKRYDLPNELNLSFDAWDSWDAISRRFL